MALTIDDILPKPTEIEVRGVKLTIKPPKLAHLMILDRFGRLVLNATASKKEADEIQKDVDATLLELIPEIEGKEIAGEIQQEIIAKIFDVAEPSDNQELKKHNIKVENNPKAERGG